MLKGPLASLERHDRPAFEGRSGSERSTEPGSSAKTVASQPVVGYRMRSRTAKKEILDFTSTTRTLRTGSTPRPPCERPSGITTKSFNIDTLSLLGAKAVTYVPHGYRDNCHFPVSVKKKDRERYGSDVVFVGTWERPRAQMLEQLNGFALRVWGNDWHRLRPGSALHLSVAGRAVYGGELARVFGASKVSLSFLRRANRDLHTSRTFEIPACGGFQLSERTEEVLNFFEEGKEIECFSSLDELKDKITYYLKHESQRLRIAAAGLDRAFGETATVSPIAWRRSSALTVAESLLAKDVVTR